jgi:hypothetical protein
MERELKILLNILKGRGNQKMPNDRFDADKLIRLAEMHGVTYPLYVFAQGHPGILNTSQAEMLSDRCRKNAIHSLDQLQELIHITGDLEQAGIPVVVLKGPQLARMVHGREALKESVDLDILLVHDTDLEKAHMRLTSSGYTQSNLNAHQGKLSRKIFLMAKREVHYYNPRNRSHIDLHVRAGANTYLTDGLFSHIFRELETFDLDGHPVTIFAREQYLVYLCYHGALHQFSRLGWLMDIRAFVLAYHDVLDYKKIIALARDIRAENALFLTYVLLMKYFEDEAPAIIEKIIPRNYRFRFLVNSCKKMLTRGSDYSLTLKGRTRRLIYMMALINNVPGRLDILFGILIRQLAH